VEVGGGLDGSAEGWEDLALVHEVVQVPDGAIGFLGGQFMWKRYCIVQSRVKR
jgi:hypothetical protein